MIKSWLRASNYSVSTSISIQSTATGKLRPCLDGRKEPKKNFAQYSSDRIFRHMYGALNVDKKITDFTVCRDESFESS
jgi:hypothetical protein